MNIIRRIGIIMLVLGVTAGLSEAASKEGKPDATLQLTGKSIAAGIGFSWGKGHFTYKGKEYPIKVDGLSLGKVGISGASASGKVYNLNRVKDLTGTTLQVGPARHSTADAAPSQ